MALKRKIRRKIRRKAPAVRRRPDATAQTARDHSAPLMIGGAHDPAEKAADRMAAQVLAGGQVAGAGSSLCSAVRRKCADCAKDEKQAVQRKASAGPVAPGSSAVTASPRTKSDIGHLGPGRPLSGGERAFFEPRYQTDFSDVRVHEGPRAEAANQSIDARAFTHGKDIAFGVGEYNRTTLAHELAHVVQNSDRIQRLDRCTSKSDEANILDSHTLGRSEIAQPGQTADAYVHFSCKPRSFKSQIVDAQGNTHLTQVKTTAHVNADGVFQRDWSGKVGYDKVGTFMAPDGVYKHQIRELAYAPGPDGDRMVNGGGIASQSPEITIKTRASVETPTTNHLHHADGTVRQDNIDLMATAIRSEAEGATDTEKRAIGWAIRNGMVAVNSHSVADAKTKIAFDVKKTGGADYKAMATDILGRNMSQDEVGNAIKWYSPNAMPPHTSNCSARDCTGGTVQLSDDKTKSSKAPGFHKHMTFVPLSGVRQWWFRFYKL